MKFIRMFKEKRARVQHKMRKRMMRHLSINVNQSINFGNILVNGENIIVAWCCKCHMRL